MDIWIKKELCKTVNLMPTTLLDWLDEMLSRNRKSYVMCYVMISWLLRALKSYAFKETLKMSAIDSTFWVKLNWWGYV